MDEDRIYFERKLPHYQPAEATYFITFRLANSLPAEVVERLKEERKKELSTVEQDAILSYKTQKKYFGKYDEYLDRVSHGPKWLSNDKVSKIVSESLHYWDGKRYTLICYCIMPNHVHLVIEMLSNEVRESGNLSNKTSGQFDKLSYVLSPIMHSIKRYTAREANAILNRTGAFWQHESYDHVVRNGEELERIIWYVLNNPVKAGLVEDWQQWKWTYIAGSI